MTCHGKSSSLPCRQSLVQSKFVPGDSCRLSWFRNTATQLLHIKQNKSRRGQLP